jgi:large subunit ribosomal protein L3
MKGILGKKLGMTRIVNEEGNYVPVTIVHCSDNVIHQLKNEDKDGYNAVVLGFEARRHPTKTKKFYYVREIRVETIDQLEKGAKVAADAVLSAGDRVSVTGVTKGKGTQGVMKRWNFHGGPGGHGSHFKREPGSVGARAKPGKIHRGKKMSGHMGSETQTLRTSVAYIDSAKNLIGIKGPVPGSINSYVTIKKLATK